VNEHMRQSASMNEMKNIFSFQGRKSQLWGNPLGREMRGEIEHELDQTAPGGTFIIDLKGIEVMDFSFATELFGRLYGTLSTGHPGRAVLLTGMSDFVRINLGAALDPLGLFALSYKSARTWELLGKAADTDKETLQALYRLKEATAPRLAETLNIKLTTCNQRLKKLGDAGAIVRTKVSAPSGGDQYIYRWPL
jgi:hypothetical protein